MSEPVAIDGDNFIDEVIDADRPVLVDCWAAWCGPCRMLAPELDAVAQEEPERLKMAKLDCDDQPELAQLMGVTLLPTMVLFVDGVVESTLKGYRTKDAILEHFRPFLKAKKASGGDG